MQDQTLSIHTDIQIRKPAAEVFEAIVDPTKMSNYFISKSTGRMEAGREIQWEFPEFAGAFPVQVKQVEAGRYLSFTWETEGQDLLVEISLTPQGEQATLVSVTEKSMPLSEAGLRWLQQNTAGWANFLACLKAYLEYGINLRQGAFEHHRAS